jgi:hypothetical protein
LTGRRPSYGFPFNPNGRNARDIELFVRHFGYTPTEALVAATKLGGEIMGMGDELGQVKQGYLADLLLVDGDPTVELIDAKPVPLFTTYAVLDLLQMQVQAGELFARLVTQHDFSPELTTIRGHNHLTQLYSVNTGDESLSRPILQFIRSHSGIGQ